MSSIHGDKVTFAHEFGGCSFNDAESSDWPGALAASIDDMPGWRSTTDLNVIRTPRGTGDGDYLARRFPKKSRMITIQGYLLAPDRETLDRMFDLVVTNAFPADTDIQLTRHEPTPKYVTCRLASAVEDVQYLIDPRGADAMRWEATVLCEDPFKYDAVNVLQGSAGVAGVASGGRTYPRVYELSAATRTNLVRNPSFEVNLASWYAPQAAQSLARSTAWAASGSASALVSYGTATSGTIEMTNDAYMPLPVAGIPYTAQFKARKAPGGAASRNLQLLIGWINSSNAQIGSSSGALVSVDANNTATITATGTPPVGTTQFYLYIFAPVAAAGDAFYIDSVMAEEGITGGPYIDGSTSGGVWSGAPHNSTSTFAPRGVRYNVTTSGEGSQVNLYNEGTADSPVVATITGPVPLGWRLELSNTGEQLSFATALSASDTLVIDTDNKTALLNGSSVAGLLSGTWWRLKPKGNTIRLYGDYSPSAGFNVTAKSAWR